VVGAAVVVARGVVVTTAETQRVSIQEQVA